MVLDLSHHCIETAARRAERRLLSALLAPADRAAAGAVEPDVGRLEEQLQLVQDFLRQADFAALRSEHSALRGAPGIRVQLQRDATGSVGWSVL